MRPAARVAADAAVDFEYVRRNDAREIDSPAVDDPRRFRYLERIGAVMRLAGTVTPPARVLELGSAQANISLLLAEAGYHAVAVDLRPDFLRYARAKWERGWFAAVAGDAFAPPLRGGAFDVVIVGELVEHVADPAALLAQAARLLAAGGLLIVTTPNGSCVGTREPRFSEFQRGRASAVPAECGPGAEDHLFALTMDELLGMLPRGLRPVHRAYVASRLINSRSHPILRRLLGDVPGWLRRVAAGLPLAGPRLAEHLVVAARRESAE